MNAELSTSSGRNGMNGGASSLPENAGGKLKLNLAELVAPVSDDLLLLNDNLQKVSFVWKLVFVLPCRFLCLLFGMQIFLFVSRMDVAQLLYCFACIWEVSFGNFVLPRRRCREGILTNKNLFADCGC